MPRDKDEIRDQIQYIQDAIQTGNTNAILDLPHAVMNIIQTLAADPDMLSNFKASSRVLELESDVYDLKHEIRVLRKDLLLATQEIDKFKKIFAFMVEQRGKSDELVQEVTPLD